ncbi:AGE family epimerase/isomerase [Amnibacterium flavum]|nr:AGE family epimerase/isomerase [Amnibacterium flavum]
MPFRPPIDPRAGTHLADLADEQDRLVGFFLSGLGDPSVPFSWLDIAGRPDRERPLPLYAVARLVHCFSVESLLGRAGAREFAQRAVRHLLDDFADLEFGGFRAEIGPTGSDRKELYGHAFALLAGASARQAHLDGAEELFDTARDAIDSHFWVEPDGVAVESWDRAFTGSEPYRGQNGNMHLTEAYLAAYEATGDAVFLDRARRIADRLVRRAAPTYGWRVPEHYTTDWQVDGDYNIDNPNDPFRPAGTLPGHALEWSRLLLGLRALRPDVDWAVEAAVQLFDTAVGDAWDTTHGGFAYSVDFDGRIINAHRMHWTVAEGIGASLSLYRATGEDRYRDWYSTFWDHVGTRVIDRKGGSWWHELDSANRPSFVTWDGKPDLYHAWQATLYARVDGDGGLAESASRGALLGARSIEGLPRG